MILNLLAGVLGIVLYTLIKARPYVFDDEEVDWGKLLRENVPSWIWAFFMLITISIILRFDPESSKVISQALGGMDLSNSFVGFLGLGMFLSFSSKEVSK